MGHWRRRQISRAVLQLCHGPKVVEGTDEVNEGSLSGMTFSFVCHGSRVCGTMLANGCHTWKESMKSFNEQST